MYCWPCCPERPPERFEVKRGCLSDLDAAENGHAAQFFSVDRVFSKFNAPSQFVVPDRFDAPIVINHQVFGLFRVAIVLRKIELDANQFIILGKGSPSILTMKSSAFCAIRKAPPPWIVRSSEDWDGGSASQLFKVMTVPRSLMRASSAGSWMRIGTFLGLSTDIVSAAQLPRSRRNFVCSPVVPLIVSTSSTSAIPKPSELADTFTPEHGSAVWRFVGVFFCASISTDIQITFLTLFERHSMSIVGDSDDSVAAKARRQLHIYALGVRVPGIRYEFGNRRNRTLVHLNPSKSMILP